MYKYVICFNGMYSVGSYWDFASTTSDNPGC